MLLLLWKCFAKNRFLIPPLIIPLTSKTTLPSRTIYLSVCDRTGTLYFTCVLVDLIAHHNYTSLFPPLKINIDFLSAPRDDM